MQSQNFTPHREEVPIFEAWPKLPHMPRPRNLLDHIWLILDTKQIRRASAQGVSDNGLCAVVLTDATAGTILEIEIEQ